MNRSKVLLLFCLLVIFPLAIAAVLAIRDRAEHGEYEDVDIKSLATIELDQERGTIDDIPLRFRKLEGHHVRMVGQMYAPHADGNGHLDGFELVYSKDSHGVPLAQMFIDANVAAGTNIYYYDEPVTVDGIFHIRFNKVNGVLKSVYAIEVQNVWTDSQPEPTVAGPTFQRQAIILAGSGMGIFLLIFGVLYFLKVRHRRDFMNVLPEPRRL